MKNLLLFGILLTSGFSFAQQSAKVEYDEFGNLMEEVRKYRQERLIDIDTFNKYSADPNTIILDTRSKWAYDEIHIQGAVHLNFSDFTVEKLAAVIPSKETRILIYCNNNIESDLSAMTDKVAPLALNIPTFINLYGYGYKNVYELQDYLSETDPRVPFVKATKK